MSVEELSSPPDLLGLYGRALVGAVLPGREALPDRRLSLREVEIDRGHLTDYDRVCGFRLSDRLPPTYLHVLAFPLALALMTDRSFPFSVLGMVHIANRIEQRRPLDAGDRPSLLAWAENLRAHRRGRQFDLVAEARLGDEVVWTERSTYLRRGEGSDQAGDGDEPEPPTGVTTELHVDGNVGRRYAAVSGDRNPIHLHGLAARLFGIHGPIAHGMWMKARCLAALDDRLTPACVAEVRFKAPLRIPAEVGLATEPRGGGVAFALRGRDAERVHMAGSLSPLP